MMRQQIGFEERGLAAAAAGIASRGCRWRSDGRGALNELIEMRVPACRRNFAFKNQAGRKVRVALQHDPQANAG